MKIFQDKYCMGHTYIKTYSLFIWNSDLIWGNTNPTSSAHRAYVPTPGCCACWLLMASTCPICWGLGWKVCAYVCREVHRNEGTSCGKLRFLPPPSKVGNLWLWLTDRSHRRQAPFLPEGSHLCAVCCVLCAAQLTWGARRSQIPAETTSWAFLSPALCCFSSHSEADSSIISQDSLSQDLS